LILIPCRTVQKAGWFGGDSGRSGVFWILLIIVIVAVIVTLARPGGRLPFGGQQGQTALDILKERYARGEIDREEYEQKRRDLGG
jgi:putative membrane protein